MCSIVLSILMIASMVGTAFADAVLTGRVTDLQSKPVAGARVHILVGSTHEATETDRNGRYQVSIEFTGEQELTVVIGAGTLHTYRHGKIQSGTKTTLDIEVEIADGEIIRIIDSKPPTVPAKPVAGKPRVTPPYSEQAVERDAWGKAWLLLDIDEKGKVVRVKLVKRPGFDLDEIAVKEAMKLAFDPALDEHGKPMRSQQLWAMEWPSYGWLVEHNGTASKLPVESYSLDPLQLGYGGFGGLAAPRTGKVSFHAVPCAGSGPLNLDQRYPVYRDCSLPNMAKANSLPWLDGTQPIPPEPKSPETIAFERAEDLEIARASLVPQLTSTAITGGLLIATTVAWMKYGTFAERMVRHREAGQLNIPAARTDFADMQTWQRRAFVLTGAGIASAGVTAFLWLRNQRRSSFSVQPESNGGSISYFRPF